MVNAKFASRNAKVVTKILPLDVSTKPKSLDNRSHVIDAVVVRIMKSRKRLDVQELISEAIK